jgi:hypothetical protein
VDCKESKGIIEMEFPENELRERGNLDEKIK